MKMNDEKKYEKVIKDLKNLQQVKAPANFEADLKEELIRKNLKQKKRVFGEKSFYLPD